MTFLVHSRFRMLNLSRRSTLKQRSLTLMEDLSDRTVQFCRLRWKWSLRKELSSENGEDKENAIRLDEKGMKEKELLRQIIDKADRCKDEFHRKRTLTCENDKSMNRESGKVKNISYPWCMLLILCLLLVPTCFTFYL